MRAVFIILVILSGLTLCYGEKANKIVRYKHHKHCHKWLILQKFYFLAFLAFKFKAILVVGSIWAITFIFGKVFAAFKLAEYMKSKSNDHHEVIYSSPHHQYDHDVYGKSIHSGPSSPDIVYDYPPKGADLTPGTGYSDSSPPTGYGRSHTVSNGTYGNFNVFFDVIKRSNLTEMVFNEMDLETDSCKRKFVCEADFNAKQITLLHTVFNMFVDDSYKSYRSDETIATIEDCSRLNPTCEDD